MNIGGQEIQTAKFCIQLGLWEEANDHLNEAKNIFEVMFGDNHRIVTEKCRNIQIQIDQKSPTLPLAPSLESVQDLNF
jgi:DNA gyrase inhibitor GyrI